MRSVGCAFVAIKLRVNGVPFLLGQQDSRWRDFTLVGGHENPKDRGNPATTARRETLEELSALRRAREFTLERIAGPISVGPKWSKSAREETQYQFIYFLLRFGSEPVVVADILKRGRSSSLVSIADVSASKVRASEIISTLAGAVPGGLEAIPLSWDHDLGPLLAARGVPIEPPDQLSLSLA